MPDALVERDGHTMVITMNRPQRYNALTGSDARADVRRDGRGVRRRRHPLRSSSPAPAATSAPGADLRAMAGDADDTDAEIDVPARMAADPDLPYKGLLRHYRPTKPIIAAVEGVAIAGGTEILQGTDIRVAGESARFGVSEARWSLYPMAGSAVRLRRQIPYTHAAEILLTGKHITAAEAARIGLIGHVVPDGQALAKALGDRGDDRRQRSARGRGHPAHPARDRRHDRGRGAGARVRVRPGRVRSPTTPRKARKAFAEKRTPNFQRK